MSQDVWVLGATGRSGRDIAARLAATGRPLVLVARNASGLQQVADGLQGRGRTLVAGSVEEMAARVTEQRPAVVVNTVGPFGRSAGLLAAAALPHSHYLDLANDVSSASALLALNEEAVAAGRTLVTGAGFGVLATESVVTVLCRDRTAPESVRVDAVPSVELEAGVLGEALAGTLLDGLPDGGRRYDGRRYERGRLVRTRLAGDRAQLTLPDGSVVTTVSWPSGELVAAQRASGAPSVLSGTSELPSSTVARAALPVATAVLSLGPVRAFARRRLARLEVAARPRPREHSWGHAQVHWADGTSRRGWLRAGDASDFTAAVAALVAARLADGGGTPGASTPAACFGADLAVEAGGGFVLA